MSRLIVEPRRARRSSSARVAVLLLGAVALVPLGLVTVKMLPFDNKSEFQVIINMPEGHAARGHRARHREAGARDAEAVHRDQRPELRRARRRRTTSTASCATTSCAGRPHQADLQVNLLPKEERSEQSHDIAKRVRAALAPLAAKAGARIQVAEVPPGPPVLQTLVAEVYGPDPARRLEVARTGARTSSARRPASSTSTGTSKRRSPRSTLDVDPQKAAAAGVPPAALASARAHGRRRRDVAGILHDDQARERRADRAAAAARRRAGPSTRSGASAIDGRRAGRPSAS